MTTKEVWDLALLEYEKQTEEDLKFILGNRYEEWKQNQQIKESDDQKIKC